MGTGGRDRGFCGYSKPEGEGPGGTGGRITDYRVHDNGSLLENNSKLTGD